MHIGEYLLHDVCLFNIKWTNRATYVGPQLNKTQVVSLFDKCNIFGTLKKCVPVYDVISCRVRQCMLVGPTWSATQQNIHGNEGKTLFGVFGYKLNHNTKGMHRCGSRE